MNENGNILWNLDNSFLSDFRNRTLTKVTRAKSIARMKTIE